MFPTTAELTEKNKRCAEAVAEARKTFVPVVTESAREWFERQVYDSVRATSNPSEQ